MALVQESPKNLPQQISATASPIAKNLPKAARPANPAAKVRSNVRKGNPVVRNRVLQENRAVAVAMKVEDALAVSQRA